MPSITDQQLISQCLEGNKDAFRLLVQAHQRRVFSLALKMVGDEEEAKDVVQETFLRVWQRLGDYDTQRSFTTWLYVIASRLCPTAGVHAQSAGGTTIAGGGTSNRSFGQSGEEQPVCGPADHSRTT